MTEPIKVMMATDGSETAIDAARRSTDLLLLRVSNRSRDGDSRL